MVGYEPPPSLDPVESEAVRWVVETAVSDGNGVAEIAEWSEALVVHMKGPLRPTLKEKAQARYPDLAYFSFDGSPHNEADEGFKDGRFAVSFPRRPRPA